MGKLNQVIAIEKGIKSRTTSSINSIYQLLDKDSLFNGHIKSYQPIDEATGDRLPPDEAMVINTVADTLEELSETYTEYFNITARKDYSNTVAKADVTVDGSVLIKDAPVTFLMFLEKQLNDVKAIFTKLPTLDSAIEWDKKDVANGLWSSKEVSTQRTKKITKPITLAPATDRHPAQVQLITEDVLAGYWNLVKKSGAIPAYEKKAMLKRLDKLSNAVKEAKEAANSIEEVTSPNVGAVVFNYLNQGE